MPVDMQRRSVLLAQLTHRPQKKLRRVATFPAFTELTAFASLISVAIFNSSSSMTSNQNKYPNDLLIYRKRIKLSQKTVAHLLGSTTQYELSRLERGHRLPSLETALKCEIIYRTPVAFLFYDLYSELRTRIRSAEFIPAFEQLTLF